MMSSANQSPPATGASITPLCTRVNTLHCQKWGEEIVGGQTNNGQRTKIRTMDRIMDAMAAKPYLIQNKVKKLLFFKYKMNDFMLFNQSIVRNIIFINNNMLFYVGQTNELCKNGFS
jgi:hypothetical protein